MKKLAFCYVFFALLLGVFSNCYATSDYEIREIYRSHFRGQTLTPDQETIIQSLSGSERGRYYAEIKQELAKELDAKHVRKSREAKIKFEQQQKDKLEHDKKNFKGFDF